MAGPLASPLLPLLVAVSAAILPQDASREAFDALARGVPEVPVPRVLYQGSCGVLELGWTEGLVPVLVGDDGVYVAATTVERGRVVAFGGQGFLWRSDPGAEDRAADDESFLGLPGNDALVRNAVRWVAGSEAEREPRVLVDNRAVADVLREGGLGDVRVARRLGDPLRPEARDWSAAALADVDVAVVLTNAFDDTHLRQDEVAALSAFLRRGGGVLVGGSSFHWEGDDPADFPANGVVAGSGIRWSGDEAPDLASARVRYRRLSSAAELWRGYLEGAELDPRDEPRLVEAFLEVERRGPRDELERALARALDETPALPAAARDPRARLSADLAKRLGPRAWPGPHPWAATFPGLPAAGTARVERDVVVDASWVAARPLGLYAPPGETVVLTFPASLADRGLWIAVGDGYDDLRPLARHAEWRRAPDLERGYAVAAKGGDAGGGDAARVEVGNPYGGPIYLLVPAPLGGPGVTIPVHAEGVIPMPVYTLGETDPEDWEHDLAGGSPQAILQARGAVRFVVPIDVARRVAEPARVLEFWRGFHASHAELAQEPVPRRFESHWIFDPQVGNGYANAAPVALAEHSSESLVDRIALPLDCLGLVLTAESGEDDYWTIGHELGHQFQTNDWHDGDLAEVGCNLFALYTKNFYVHDGGEFETVSFEEDDYRHEDLLDFRWAEVGDWEKLELYRQLVLEFGWTPMRRTFASYYDPAYPRSEYKSHLDGFAIRFSALVQRDLTPFLRHWEYPLSEEAEARIHAFGFEPWMPPGWPAPGEGAESGR